METAVAEQAEQQPQPSRAVRTFIVVHRVVDQRGNNVSGGGRGIERHTEGEAIDIIKAELAKHERSGFVAEFAYWWAWTAKHPGCAPEYIHRWSLARFG